MLNILFSVSDTSLIFNLTLKLFCCKNIQKNFHSSDFLQNIVQNQKLTKSNLSQIYIKGIQASVQWLVHPRLKPIMVVSSSFNWVFSRQESVGLSHIVSVFFSIWMCLPDITFSFFIVSFDWPSQKFLFHFHFLRMII